MVLDRSGSMESIRDDVIGGMNAFFEEQRKVPGDCKVTIVQFDSIYETVCQNTPLVQVPLFNRENYVPRGSTALLDAIGRTLNTIEAETAQDKPDKIYFVIVTDGAENSSVEFTDRSKIFQMISERRQNSAWEFIFLAANQDAISEAANYGISAANALNFVNNPASTQGTYAVLSDHISGSRTTGQSISFNASDQNRAYGH